MALATSGVRWQRLAGAALCALAVSGCSEEEMLRGGAGGGAGGGQGAGQDGAAGAGTGVGIPVGGASGGAPCGGSDYRAQGAGLEILVLFDKSGSMVSPACTNRDSGCSCNKGSGIWAEAVSQMQAFMDSTAGEQDVSLALKLFSPLAPDSAEDEIAGSFGDTCSPAFYSQPDVPMGPAMTTAPVISSTLDQACPNGDTATKAVIEGAIQYFDQRTATAGYNAKPIILLVTDGEPDDGDCPEAYGNTLRGASDMAATAAAAGYPVYVVAMGDELQELDQIASGGGTDAAVIVSGGALLDAVNGVRDDELAQLPCQYAVPTPNDGAVFEKSLVSLRFTPSGGQLLEVPKVGGAGGCDATVGGWHYDDEATPNTLIACPTTCDALRGDGGGEVKVVLGCAPVLL